jgi:hypothetical protein
MHNPLRSRPPVEIPDRPSITKAQKTAIWNRENGICWYCLKPVAALGPDVIYDHKTPRALNGSDDLDGIFPIHARPCNERKTHGPDGDIATVAQSWTCSAASAASAWGWSARRLRDGRLLRNQPEVPPPPQPPLAGGPAYDDVCTLTAERLRRRRNCR